jgi:hypothetical protein
MIFQFQQILVLAYNTLHLLLLLSLFCAKYENQNALQSDADDIPRQVDLNLARNIAGTTNVVADSIRPKIRKEKDQGIPNTSAQIIFGFPYESSVHKEWKKKT